MPRASVYEKPRFGTEATAGTQVAADKVMKSFETFTANPEIPRTAIEAAGQWGAVGVYGAKEHTEWSGDGVVIYNEIGHLLASAFCKPVAGSVTSGAKELTYRPKNDQTNDIQTFTVETGSPDGASRFVGAFANDLSFTFVKDSVKFSASGQGMKFEEDGVVLTANPTEVVLVPVEPNTVSVYVADTYANLPQSASRLKVCTSATFGISGRQTPIFTLDDTVQSYSTTVERKGTQLSAQIVMQQDSQGVAMMNRMRNKNIFWCRIEALGNVIGSGQRYTFSITFPCFVNKNQRSDTDDLYAGTYDLTPVKMVDAFGSGNSGIVEIKLKLPTAETDRVIAVSQVATPVTP